jgi:spore maturation protein CgeB
MIRLFINWYQDSKPERAAELELCLSHNLNLSAIDEVVNIGDTPIGNEDRYIKHFSRITYNDYFKVINEIAGPDDISIIANLDIVFNDTILHAVKMQRNECYALTRYDATLAGITFFNRADSQDVWIFKGKPPQIVGADFNLGVPGCDNRIAYLLNLNGYLVTNPSLTIKTYHYHNSNIRNYMNARGYSIVKAVPGPYLMLKPLALTAKGVVTIYHIGMFKVNEPQWYLRNMLKSIGNYIEDDWPTLLKQLGKVRFRQYVLTQCRTHKPDVVFMQLQTPDVLDVATVTAMRKMGIRVFNWTGDVRAPLPLWYITLGKACSATLFTNETDVEQAQKMAIKADYFQITDDETIYSCNGPLKRVGEIVFMGNHYANIFPLSSLRYNMVMELRKAFPGLFAVVGSGWKGAEAMNLNFKQEEESAVYRGCKIAINCSHFDYERYSSNRLFRIMLSGAFCLSHHYKGIEKDFEVGAHLDTWRTIDELKEKVKYYLENEQLRNAIAQAGHEHVKLNHSRFKRAEELKELIKRYW